MASPEELNILGTRMGEVCPALIHLWSLQLLISTEILELDFVSTNAGKRDEYILFNPKQLLKHDNVIVGAFSNKMRK